MKQVIYPGVVEKDDDSDYGIWFPDFPGCVSAGDTVEAAVKGGREALQLHIQGMIEDKEDIPSATQIEKVNHAHSRVAAVVLVPVSIPGKAARVQVTMDEHLLAEIDAIADNRSGFLAEAARAELARRAH